MLISIIICTHNRPRRLSKMLESLICLKYDNSFNYEMIIVDNNSTDNTKQIIESYILKNNKIKYHLERNRGISNARNAGINISKGEIIAFTDDDIILDNNWLLNIAQFNLKFEFDAIAGRVLPLYPENTPQWIKDCRDLLNGPIVCHDHGGTIQLYNSKMFPFVGANMIIKRKLFDEVGVFNTDLGPGKGTMGDDTEFFRRIQNLNKKIYYNPNVLIIHPVEKERMNFKYFAKWNISYGKYLVFKNNKNHEKNVVLIFGIPRYLYRGILISFWKMIKFINNKNQFVESWCNLFKIIGMMFAYRSLIKNKINNK